MNRGPPSAEHQDVRSRVGQLYLTVQLAAGVEHDGCLDRFGPQSLTGLDSEPSVLLPVDSAALFQEELEAFEKRQQRGGRRNKRRGRREEADDGGVESRRWWSRCAAFVLVPLGGVLLSAAAVVYLQRTP